MDYSLLHEAYFYGLFTSTRSLFLWTIHFHLKLIFPPVTFDLSLTGFSSCSCHLSTRLSLWFHSECHLFSCHVMAFVNLTLTIPLWGTLPNLCLPAYVLTTLSPKLGCRTGTLSSTCLTSDHLPPQNLLSSQLTSPVSQQLASSSMSARPEYLWLPDSQLTQEPDPMMPLYPSSFPFPLLFPVLALAATTAIALLFLSLPITVGADTRMGLGTQSSPHVSRPSPSHSPPVLWTHCTDQMLT